MRHEKLQHKQGYWLYLTMMALYMMVYCVIMRLLHVSGDPLSYGSISACVGAHDITTLIKNEEKSKE